MASDYMELMAMNRHERRRLAKANNGLKIHGSNKPFMYKLLES